MCRVARQTQENRQLKAFPSGFTQEEPWENRREGLKKTLMSYLSLVSWASVATWAFFIATEVYVDRAVHTLGSSYNHVFLPELPVEAS